LFSIGCQFIRQKGDHRIYRRKDLARPLVIPAEKDLPIFIIRNNLRILGIAPAEYLKILKKL
jgi:predicted RNA binding protein YcfA (HicA-like mRNA interferase family)